MRIGRDYDYNKGSISVVIRDTDLDIPQEILQMQSLYDLIIPSFY